MQYRGLIVTVALLTVLVLAIPAVSDVPQRITYQGRLTTAGGDPIDTTAGLILTIYSDKLGTTPIWNETHANVSIENGLFTIILGSHSSFGPALFNGQTRYLGVQLSGGAMSHGLVPLVSTPYAVRSARADTASYALAAPGGGGSGWTDDGNVVRLTNVHDSVGIGTNDPGVPLEVEGAVTAIVGHSLGSGTAFGVFGANDNDGTGVLGTSNSGYGVHGISVSGFGGYFYGPKSYVSGKLGVGTDSPTEKLHLYDDASGADVFLKVQSDHATNWGKAGLRIETPLNGWDLRTDDYMNADLPNGCLGVFSDQDAVPVMAFRPTGEIGIGTEDPAYRLDVDAAFNTLRVSAFGGYVSYFEGPKNYFSGKVGIGTEDPTHKLTVNGDLAIQSGGDTKFHINYYNGGLNISETTVADYRLNIEAGGNVGIGTGNPSAKLHVNGDTKIAGTLTADGFADNTINRYDIVDEVGLASATLIDGSYLTPSWTSCLSKVIHVPSAGYILALGSAYCQADHGADGHSRPEIVISDLPDDANGGTASRFYLAENVAPGDYGCSLRCRRLAFADSAGVYTYHLLCRMDGPFDATISRKQLDLLFIPTAYSAKNMADGSDADYVAGEGFGNPGGSTTGMNAMQPVSSEIEQLRAELAALRRTVEELQARVD